MIQYSRFLEDDRFAVFLFHGVIEENRHPVRNYTSKHLSRGRFEEILSDLAAHGTPASLDQVIGVHGNGQRLPRRAFVITFDDGFENNLSCAAPVLERMKIPSTFYVTSKFVDEQAASWTDLVEYAVELRDEVVVDLPCASGRFVTREEKIDLLDRIRAHVKGHPEVDPYDFVDEVWRQLRVERLEPDPALDRKLDWSQVRELDRHPLFTVGGHGHTHRILAFLSPPALREEIGTSLSLMRRHLPGPIRHYSYPEGLAHCYSPQVIDCLKSEGIICSPTAETGVNRVGDDPFRLKRVMVTT